MHAGMHTLNAHQSTMETMRTVIDEASIQHIMKSVDSIILL
jgi:hypothetical protein